MIFRDLFSDRAEIYARYRPSYPARLFDWVAGLVEQRRLAWDCATGNGQAALDLAERFERVVATDASERQIANADPHSKISYVVVRAEWSALRSHSVDLVTVAQALHWLEVTPFYSEVRRVLRGGGAIAVWGYGDPVLDDLQLHRIVHEFNRGTLESYWRPERDLLLAGYRNMPFPFREVNAPSLTMEPHWNLPELAGYLRTWSATAAYIAAHGIDPVAEVERELARHWGDPDRRRVVRWPLYVRAGYLA